MLYALEGAIQGIRWHCLDKVRKQELKEFNWMINKKKRPTTICIVNGYYLQNPKLSTLNLVSA